MDVRAWLESGAAAYLLMGLAAEARRLGYLAITPVGHLAITRLPADGPRGGGTLYPLPHPHPHPHPNPNPNRNPNPNPDPHPSQAPSLRRLAYAGLARFLGALESLTLTLTLTLILTLTLTLTLMTITLGALESGASFRERPQVLRLLP